MPSVGPVGMANTVFRAELFLLRVQHVGKKVFILFPVLRMDVIEKHLSKCFFRGFTHVLRPVGRDILQGAVGVHTENNVVYIFYEGSEEFFTFPQLLLCSFSFNYATYTLGDGMYKGFFFV